MFDRLVHDRLAELRDVVLPADDLEPSQIACVIRD
jgi:hypothetical protein